MQHVTVYRDRDRYAGWPANYGIWSWSGADAVGADVEDGIVGDADVGDKIVVGFTLGYPDPDGGFHRRDRKRPFVTMLARSLDGGLTWQVDECPCRTPGRRPSVSAAASASSRRRMQATMPGSRLIARAAR
jgi:hypothetical protein